MLRVVVLPTSTVKSFWLKDWNPGLLTVSVYRPGWSSGKVKRPSALDLPEYALPVLDSLSSRELRE
jgi:hypothetical protein